MPPKKRTTRAAQLQPQAAVVSDYDETDTAAFTDNAAAHIAPPPSRTNTELNLLVLRRYCPDVERIMQIAPFAVVYSFSPDTQGWEKIGTEGTLFVCQLAGASYPRYSVIILNRKSLDNFIVELVSAENVEITDSYVILQSPGEDGDEQIYGLWIFSEENTTPSTQEVVAMAIQECALRAEEGKKLAEEPYDGDLAAGYGAGPGDAQQTDAPYQVEPLVESIRPVQPMPPAGQQIDLMQLFAKPQSQPQQQQQQIMQMDSEPPQHYYQQHQQPPSDQQPKFASNPDTDFFRSTHSPAVPIQAQQPPSQAPAQQNMLLDMFNSARRG